MRARHFLTGLLFLSITGVAHAATLKDLVKSARNVSPGMFGETEIAVTNRRLPEGWLRVLADMALQHEDLTVCDSYAVRCTYDSSPRWRQMIRGAAGKSRLQQINYVNGFFNKFPYRLDSDAYGQSDYWASPSEFMMWSGDCEDFAIAKFLALRQLGIGNDDMRIVVVYDSARGLVHAVLALELAGQTLVLDSLSNEILPESRYGHFVAQYSLNESGLWLHTLPRRLAEGPSPLLQPRLLR